MTSIIALDSLLAFFRTGNGEFVKAGWHRGLFLLCRGAALYNGGAFVVRWIDTGSPEWRLARNALLYESGAQVEKRKIAHHADMDPR